MNRQDVTIPYSGGKASLALYTLAVSGHTRMCTCSVRLLIDSLRRPVNAGNTVMVIEHNIMDIAAASDWIIDLGPGGGKYGRKFIFSGTPHQLLESEVKSATKDALKKGFNSSS